MSAIEIGLSIVVCFLVFMQHLQSCRIDVLSKALKSVVVMSQEDMRNTVSTLRLLVDALESGARSSRMVSEAHSLACRLAKLAYPSPEVVEVHIPQVIERVKNAMESAEKCLRIIHQAAGPVPVEQMSEAQPSYTVWKNLEEAIITLKASYPGPLTPLESVGTFIDLDTGFIYAMNRDNTPDIDSVSTLEDIENDDWWDGLSEPDRAVVEAYQASVSKEAPDA